MGAGRACFLSLSCQIESAPWLCRRMKRRSWPGLPFHGPGLLSGSRPILSAHPSGRCGVRIQHGKGPRPALGLPPCVPTMLVPGMPGMAAMQSHRIAGHVIFPGPALERSRSCLGPSCVGPASLRGLVQAAGRRTFDFRKSNALSG